MFERHPGSLREWPRVVPDSYRLKPPRWPTASVTWESRFFICAPRLLRWLDYGLIPLSILPSLLSRCRGATPDSVHSLRTLICALRSFASLQFLAVIRTFIVFLDFQSFIRPATGVRSLPSSLGCFLQGHYSIAKGEGSFSFGVSCKYPFDYGSRRQVIPDVCCESSPPSHFLPRNGGIQSSVPPLFSPSTYQSTHAW